MPPPRCCGGGVADGGRAGPDRALQAAGRVSRAGASHQEHTAAPARAGRAGGRHARPVGLATKHGPGGIEDEPDRTSDRCARTNRSRSVPVFGGQSRARQTQALPRIQMMLSMRSMDDRSLEAPRYGQVGSVGRTLAGPRRLEMGEMPGESGAPGTSLCSTQEPP